MNTQFIRCRATLRSKLCYYGALIFFPLGGLISACCFVLLGAVIINIVKNNNLIVDGTTVMGFLVTFLILIADICISFFSFKVIKPSLRLETRRIAFEEAGFTVRDRKDRWYTWDQVGGIGVIAFDASASKEIYQTEICIFLVPITQKDLKKLRDSYWYGAFHPEKFVLLDYTPSAMETVSKYWPLPIPDYCEEQSKL